MVLAILSILLCILLVWCVVRNYRLGHRLKMADWVYRETNLLWAIVDFRDDRKLRVPIASNALLDIVGISLDDLPQSSPGDFIKSEDLSLLEMALEDDKYKALERMQLRLRSARYGWQWFECHGFLIREKVFFFTYYPINERIRISEELLEAKHRMNIMLENSFCLVWTLDCSIRKLELLSDVTRERFGVDDHKAGPLSSNEDYFLKEDIVEFRKFLNGRIEALLKSGEDRDKPQSFTVRVKNRDGSVVRFVTRSTLEKNEVGGFMLYGVSRLATNDELH